MTRIADKEAAMTVDLHTKDDAEAVALTVTLQTHRLTHLIYRMNAETDGVLNPEVMLSGDAFGNILICFDIGGKDYTVAIHPLNPQRERPDKQVH